MEEIKRMLEDDETSFVDFYYFLRDKDIGEWDKVNSEDIIKEYISEMMRQGIRVSHILEALDRNRIQSCICDKCVKSIRRF